MRYVLLVLCLPGMMLTGRAPQTLAEADLGALDKFGLTPLLFDDHSRTEVTVSQWHDAVQSKFASKAQLACLMMAFVVQANIDDLQVDTKLFQEVKARRLPLVTLYKALFFHISEGSRVLSMAALRDKMVWAVLSAEQQFGPAVPLSVTYEAYDWETYLREVRLLTVVVVAVFDTALCTASPQHLAATSPEAHKLLLSSLVRLSGLKLKQIEGTPHRDCFTLECVIS